MSLHLLLHSALSSFRSEALPLQRYEREKLGRFQPWHYNSHSSTISSFHDRSVSNHLHGLQNGLRCDFPRPADPVRCTSPSRQSMASSVVGIRVCKTNSENGASPRGAREAVKQLNIVASYLRRADLGFVGMSLHDQLSLSRIGVRDTWYEGGS